MGGRVSRENFVTPEGKPVHYFEIPQTRLAGGAFPISRECLEFLERKGVGLIVTLTLEPLRSGRNINHQTCVDREIDETSKSCPEFVDADPDLMSSEVASRIEFFHLPLPDGGVPNEEQITQLLDRLIEFRDRSLTSEAEKQKKKILFHCWAGGGRTSTILILLLQRLHGMGFWDARALVAAHNPRFRLTEDQTQFFKNQIESILI